MSNRSAFIDKQSEEPTGGRNPVPAFFYCAHDPLEPGRADPAVILRSLVRQLCCLQAGSEVMSPVRSMYDLRSEEGDTEDPLTVAESTALIVELSQSRPITIIVVDALDECELKSRDQIFDSLAEILSNANGIIKILVSSREERDISCQLELTGCLNLEIRASDNQADINRFVHHEMETLISKRRLLFGNVPEDLRQTIEGVLCEKVGGM